MDGPSSITLTTKSELSLLYRVLRRVIRPLRPRLVKPGKPLPAGSPALSPPKSLHITHSQSHSINLYTYQADHATRCRTPSNPPRHQLFYFAGGGFQSPPSREHWKTLDFLSRALRDSYCVTLVSYPLAPHSAAPESLGALRTWLDGACAAAVTRGHSVTLMGDSAGGNVALNLAFWWADQVVNQQARNPLSDIVVISPATDLRNVNPDIREADRRDPVLTVRMTTEVGRKWAGSWGVGSPMVSPNLADFNLLRQSGVRVHGVLGTSDVLGPDAEVFSRCCEKNGAKGEWLVWEGQMHCFVLAAVYGLPEGKKGRDWVLDVLKRYA